MRKYAIIVAGGKGLRMGSDIPKQFLPVGGVPVLMRTLQTFYAYDAALSLVLVLPASQQDYWQSLCRQHHFTVPHRIVCGGDTRFHSVKNGLDSILREVEESSENKVLREAEASAMENDNIPTKSEASTKINDIEPHEAEPPTALKDNVPLEAGSGILVAVHDGVRPFVAPEVIEACFQAAQRTGAAIPVVDVVETVRQLTPDGDSRTVSRSDYKLVQTPQVFSLQLLRRAYAQPYDTRFTDDASVVEALGHQVTLVPGNRENIKITTPYDIKVANALV